MTPSLAVYEAHTVSKLATLFEFSWHQSLIHVIHSLPIVHNDGQILSMMELSMVYVKVKASKKWNDGSEKASM